MIIFGLNLPLPELFLLLIIVFFVFLVMILAQLQKLQKMTAEERKEIEELETLVQEEKKDLEQLKAFEKMESYDLVKFEKELFELEEETDTIYLRKLAPNLFKLQNYVLWALKKGLSPKQIKENLLSKGWKDTKFIEMVIDDTLKYQGYYKNRKGKVESPSIKIEETTKIIQPVKVVKVEKPEVKKTVERAPPHPKARKVITAKPRPSDDLSKIESELTALQKDLTKEKKVTTRKTKSKKKATTKKKTGVKAKKTVVRSSVKKRMVLGTKGGNKYHKPTCIVMKKVPKDKVVTFKNNEEALKKGYKPCTVCAVESSHN